jgi:hypothetical protein
MLIALNIVLATAVVAGMVALLAHAIRAEHRHHQLQAEASHAEALRRNAPARRVPARRAPQRHAAAGKPAPAWRRDGEFSPSRG